MVEVTEEEVKNSVKLIPSWTTVVRGRGVGLSCLRSVWLLPGACPALAFEGTVGHQVCQPQHRGRGSPALLESNGAIRLSCGRDLSLGEAHGRKKQFLACMHSLTCCPSLDSTLVSRCDSERPRDLVQGSHLSVRPHPPPRSLLLA